MIYLKKGSVKEPVVEKRGGIDREHGYDCL